MNNGGERSKWELPPDLSYGDWVNYIFDHPVLEKSWWWQDEESGYFQFWRYDAEPARALSHITRLFKESGELVGRFSRKQIDQGLAFLIGTSEQMFVVRDTSLPCEDRRTCIEAMSSLYSDLIAPIYGDDTYDKVRDDPERPTFGVSMLWDSIPLYGGLDHPEIELMNDAVLGMFEGVLKLDAESCLDSVLFGLTEWSYYVPDRTRPIVERFLKRDDISPGVRRYAQHVAEFAESMKGRRPELG